MNDVQRVKRALRWLAGQLGRGRYFNYDQNVDMRNWLRVYCDASFASNPTNLRSRGCVVLYVGGEHTGTAVDFKTWEMKFFVGSSGHAEVAAAATGMNRGYSLLQTERRKQ